MQASLYDHRKKYSDGFYQNLGKIERFSCNGQGDLRIYKTDLLYSLIIHFTKGEMESLRTRLNELHDKKSRVGQALVLVEAQEILKQKAGK